MNAFNCIRCSMGLLLPYHSSKDNGVRLPHIEISSKIPLKLSAVARIPAEVSILEDKAIEREAFH